MLRKFLQYMPRLKNKNILEFLSLAVLAFTYASFGIWIRLLSPHLTLFQQMYLWLFSGTVITFILFHRKIRFSVIRKIQFREASLLFFRATTFYTIGTTLWGYAILNATYGNVAFINALPMGAILGIILLKEAITPKKFLALIISFLGLLLISVKSVSQSFSIGIGEITAFLSLFFYSLTYVIRKKQSERLNTAESTIVILALSSVSLFLLSLLLGEGIPLITISIIPIILTAGLANVIMQFLITYSFKNQDVVVASTILNLDTVFGIIIAIILYHEIPTYREAIGGFLICIGAIYMKIVVTKTPVR